MVTNRDQVDRLSICRVEQLIRRQNILPSPKGCCEGVQPIEPLRDLDRTDRTSGKITPHVRKSLQIRDDLIGQIGEQRSERVRRSGLAQERSDTVQRPAKVGR